MVRVVRLAMVFFVLVGVFFGGTASQTGQATAANVDVGVRTFFAVLKGSEEVPPNASNGTGLGLFAVSPDETEVTFVLLVKRVANITAAHLHRAPRGSNGPVVYTLSGPFTKIASGALPFNAADLPDMQNGNFYVNVHSQLFPGGEIRGQLKKASN